MNREALKASWEKGRIPFLICAFGFLYLLNLSWLKWGDLIVDTGREAYVPLELSSGKLLYRDVFYLYGPFSPYFNAFLFKVFGAHINTLIASGIITAAGVSFLIYKISRVFLNALFSAFAVLTFLFVFAFGQYLYLANYNFILPFSYSAIHSILFALAAAYSFYQSLFITRYRYICPLFILLTFLCRIEIGLALELAILPPLIFYSLSQSESIKKALCRLFVYLILPLGFTAAVYGLFFLKAFDIIKESNLFEVYFSINTNINVPFVSMHLGSGDIFGNVVIMFASFFYHLFFCLFFGAGGTAIARLRRKGPLFKKNLFSFLAGSACIAISALLFKKLFNHELQYRCLPIICLLTFSISLWKFLKMKWQKEQVFLMALSLFSLFLVSRKLFYSWAGHYGFYLLVPAMLTYYIFFLNITAGVLNAGIARRFFSFGFLCIFIMFIISHFNISRFCYKNKALKVSTPRGVLFMFNNGRENRCKELIDFLRADTPRQASLVVFPEGLPINFLSERENPLYYYSYLPFDLVKTTMTEKIISEMENKKVAYVALVQRDTSEYGCAVFGRDYGRPIWKYILENYVLYKQFGPFPFTSQDYGIALFKRKAEGAYE